MRLTCAVLCAALAALAPANDAWLASGGSAATFRKHPTVRMKDEHVTIRVGKDRVETEVLFTFVNDGPATSVKMGFPDDVYHREVDEDNKPALEGFRSWVNGTRVRTKFEQRGTDFYHTKIVRMPARASVRVKNRYHHRIGLSAGWGDYETRLVGYTLHTGATWKGRIGRTVVDVIFEQTFFRPVRTESDVSLHKLYKKSEEKWPRSGINVLNSYLSKNRNTVFCYGPSRPVLRNGRLRFTRTNYEPTEEDDVHLEFVAPRPAAASGKG